MYTVPCSVGVMKRADEVDSGRSELRSAVCDCVPAEASSPDSGIET